MITLILIAIVCCAAVLDFIANQILHLIKVGWRGAAQELFDEFFKTVEEEN